MNSIWTQLLNNIGPHVCNRLHGFEAVPITCSLHAVVLRSQRFAQRTMQSPRERELMSTRLTVNRIVSFDRRDSTNQFALVDGGRATPIYVTPGSPDTVLVVAQAFARDLKAVSGIRPDVLTSIPASPPRTLVIAGVIGHSTEIDRMRREGKLRTESVDGKWESALTTVVRNPTTWCPQCPCHCRQRSPWSCLCPVHSIAANGSVALELVG